MSDSHEEIFDTRSAYLKAVDAVLAAATRDICIFDPDLTALDLDRRARAEQLTAFLAGGDRSLRLVLHEAGHLEHHCPRLMDLLRHFGHCFHVRCTPEALRHLTDCFVLSDGANGAIRFHADHFRGKLLLSSPTAVHGWQRRFEDLWLESSPCVSPTRLGL